MHSCFSFQACWLIMLAFLNAAIMADEPIHLQVLERLIKVNGKEAKVFAILQPDGTHGLTAKKGQEFNVILENSLQVPTSVHWHGLILPPTQDGVAFITQFPLFPGLSYHYRFPLIQAGTFWMHSHFGLQEQKLLTAPLILHEPEDVEIADQEVVILLSDFSFKSPLAIFEELRSQCKKMAMSSPKESMSKMQDINDVNYDAFLANSRTLEDPEIIEVESNKRVRLRLINGASASNFFISLGSLEGEAIAVDGNRVQSLRGSRFELAAAQRIDILVKIPSQGGAFPIFAQGEGTDKQTGVVLATKGSPLPLLSSKAESKAGRLTNAQELLLRALYPLAIKPVEQRIELELGGDMQNYVWTLNGQAWPEVTPLIVEKGKRIEISFKSVSSMSHPMHLHGHVFQVVAIDGQKIEGPLRDTVLVTPHSTVNIQFDADNPGVWPLHCHILYHLEGGMLTVVRYKDYIQPL
jgi:FtsP/CotA-like multicopper oxidase with cupredoxin domain